jgi:hypothetical protein
MAGRASALPFLLVREHLFEVAAVLQIGTMHCAMGYHSVKFNGKNMQKCAIRFP